MQKTRTTNIEKQSWRTLKLKYDKLGWGKAPTTFLRPPVNP